MVYDISNENSFDDIDRELDMPNPREWSSQRLVPRQLIK